MENLTALAADPAVWAALATLIAMEVVLGIDNLIFISILSNKLPEHQRSRGRRIGIGLALIPTMVAEDAQVGVDIRGRREIFQLVKPPFVDPNVRES